MTKGLFVVGTGTDVGKTYVTGLLLKRLREEGKKAAYYKAAISGNEKDEDGNIIPGDPQKVKFLSGIEQDLKDMCPYVYEMAVSPHLASRLEGKMIEMEVVKEGYKKALTKGDYLVMEGSGGILCPIRFDDTKIWLEDFIKEFKLPCVLIADAGLGTINQVLLTCYYMKSKGYKVNGIIFNHYHKGDVMEEDNIKMCEYMTGIPVVGFVKDNGENLEIDENNLELLFDESK